MLNPPLALLSDDLLVSIVEHVAKLPSKDEDLYNLSLTDRAFTQSCQKYIFRNLKFNSRRKISKNIVKAKKILHENPSVANQVRMVELLISRRASWVFNDNAFNGVLQLLSKSLMPPHELHFGGHPFSSFMIKDPIIAVRQLGKSFFSQTLTILHLTECANVPLPLFLICPKLREVFLDHVGAAEKSYDNYPDDQCLGREALLLEVLNCRDSHGLVEQIITPPPRFNTPVVLWSNLRVLTLDFRDKEGMACLQFILDAACNTLEELYLTSANMGESQQLSLSGPLNLSNIPNLHVFSLSTFIKCSALRNAVLDIKLVLGTIPGSNEITNLWFDFTIVGWGPGFLEQDWVRMFNEVIRIADRKPLELELQMVLSTGGLLQTEHPGQAKYLRIMERAASLRDYPNICTHILKPTFCYRGLVPFPHGQVRGMCKR